MTTPQDSIFAGMSRGQFCRGSVALDEHGAVVDPTSNHARSWCAMGWLMRHEHLTGVKYEPWRVRATALARRLGYYTIVEANDRLGWNFIEALQQERI